VLDSNFYLFVEFQSKVFTRKQAFNGLLEV